MEEGKQLLRPGQPGWKPNNWHEVLNNIRQMRAARDAPVDNMGAEKCMDEDVPPEVYNVTLLLRECCWSLGSLEGNRFLQIQNTEIVCFMT